YGAVEPVELDAGERHVVDTGHVVAFTEEVSWDVTRVGGLKSSLLSGEGLVCEFGGPGTVWLQTRSHDAFLSWLIPQLPTREE
ncbi:MAG: AIM24 family protein, partial [Haloarculaceae archaeon]